MRCRLVGARPIVGAMDEYQVALDDDDTGRFLVIRDERDSKDCVLRVVRATVADQHRPLSSAVPVPDGVIEVRDNHVYVNRPMRGSIVAVVVRVDSAEAKKPRARAPKARLFAESMSIIDRIGELAQDLIDAGPTVDENPSDAPGQPKGRRKAE